MTDNSFETQIYRNKYRKIFIDSVSIGASTPVASANLLNKPYEFQDPSYVGFTIKFDFNDVPDLYDYDNLPNSLLISEDNEYSAINYLENINEPTRAQYLRNFIAGLQSLQNDTPWYFQSINGLDTLQTIDATNGMQLGEGTEITIELLESIDMRISALIDLYRKAVWDSTYRRWMLPQNMRWFKVEIIIAEFREFHIAKNSIDSLPSGNNAIPGLGKNINGSIASQVASMSSAVGKVSSSITRFKDANNRISNIRNADNTANISENLVTPTNAFLPMHIITLDMCEFNFLNRSHPYVGSINMNDSNEAIAQKISFFPGRVVEDHVYTLHNIYLREDSMRQLVSSTQLMTAEMQEVIMGKQDGLPINRIHNVSNTNFIKDSIKSIIGGIATNAIDSFVAKLFLSTAYNSKSINDTFESRMQAARESLTNQITTYLNIDGISNDLGTIDFNNPNESGIREDLGNAIINEKIAYKEPEKEILLDDTFIYKEPTNSNTIKYNNIQLDINPSNIGFDLPDINVNILGSIDLD